MQVSTIVKTDAITLRVTPFSNTSHIVTWLTPEFGKIATVIKGACRPKSPVFGQYDMGYLCELLFYSRNHNGLHIVKECTAIDNRASYRGDWRITAAISYLCHLVSIAIPDETHTEGMYELLNQTVKMLAEHRNLIHTPSLFQFELQLLKRLGLSPQLECCTSCRTNMYHADKVFFSATAGGLICDRCHNTSKDLQVFSPQTVKTLHRWQRLSSVTLHPKLNSVTKEQIQRLLGSFLTHHIDLAPACRAVAYQTLQIPNSTTIKQ